MELTFVQQSGKYVAEFEAAGDFNLHVEKPYGPMWISQRTAGTKWDRVKEIKGIGEESTLDYDFTALVYPKFIKIECEVEPTYAVVVSSGEVTEIKAQAKEIEITNNGTTEVIPDSGFAYLSKVNIKTNVPQNGGGEGSGSTMEYFAYDKNNLALSLLRIFSTIQKGQIVVEASNTNELCILPGILASQMAAMADSYTLIAIAIDWSQRARIPIAGNSVVPLLDVIIEHSNGSITKEDIAALPRITEEEFYNLNA